jgi:hypothetical protein
MEIRVPWKEPREKELQEYLQSTVFCEKEDEEMLAVLAELIKDVRTPMEALIRIFDFNKNKIKYTLDPPKPSTEVLKSGTGNCFNKASLQIAMLRACSIPARYRMDNINIRTLKPFVPESIYLKDIVKGRKEEEIFGSHFSVEAYVNGKWICCDASNDISLLPFSYSLGNGFLFVLPDYWAGLLGTTSTLPVDELEERFKSRGHTHEFIRREITPYLENIRKLPPDKKYEHYCTKWGNKVFERFLRCLVLNSKISVPSMAVCA